MLSIVDASVLLGYLGFLMYLGMRRRARKQTGDDDYLLMGRQLTLPAFVMTLVSTWYGGILGVSEYSYRFGLSNWIVFGVPYYIFAILFALLLAKRARRTQVASIPQLLQQHYGPATARSGAAWVLVLATPAPHILTVGAIVHFLTGWPLLWTVPTAALFSLLYVYRDGLSIIVRTDFLQCLLMYGGILTLFVFAWREYGAPWILVAQLSETHPNHLTWHGGNSTAYILVWFFIASWTLVSPGFHQRVYAAKNEVTAKRGILISVVFWCCFDCMTTSIGLYAVSAMPDLESPKMAYLFLGEHLLPIGAYGLFLTGMLAVVMSTLDSQLFLSGSTLGRDLMASTQLGSRCSTQTLTRLGMAIIAVLAVCLALYLPSVVQMYYTIGTLAVPALLLPVLGALGLIPKAVPAWALRTVWLTPMAAAGWWMLALEQYTGMPPFYAGVVVASICWTAGIYSKR